MERGLGHAVDSWHRLRHERPAPTPHMCIGLRFAPARDITGPDRLHSATNRNRSTRQQHMRGLGGEVHEAGLLVVAEIIGHHLANAEGAAESLAIKNGHGD